MNEDEINSLEHRVLIGNGREFKNYILNTKGQVYSLKNKMYLKPNNFMHYQQSVPIYLNHNKETLVIHKALSETFPDLMSHTPLSRFIKSGGQLTRKAKRNINLEISVDHKDRNPHNNSISNLRFSTKTEQNLNSGPNKSGTCVYKGVSEKIQRKDHVGIVVVCVFAKKKIPLVGFSGGDTKYRRVYTKNEHDETQREFASVYDETLKVAIRDQFSDHPILADEIIDEVVYFNSNTLLTNSF